MSRRNKGFTLVEMLCTIVVMLLVSATVTVGIRLAADSYVRSITASESQVLCSTVLDAVTDELRFSKISDWGDPVKFESDRYSGLRHFEVESGQVTVVPETQDNESKTEKLLPSKTYPNGMQVVLTLTGDQTNRIVTVAVQVNDPKGNKLIERSREVEILNGSSDAANG